MRRAQTSIVGIAATGRCAGPATGARSRRCSRRRCHPPRQPPDQPQLPTFRTGANLVRVDVTVLDHRGNPVPSLKPEDFLIEEDGVPQKVTSLKFIEATGQPIDDSVAADPFAGACRR